MNENRSQEFALVASIASPSIQGLLSILFGLSALLFLLLPQVSMVLVFAVYALLEGALATFRAFRAVDRHGGRWLLLLESCLDLAIAALIFAFPSFWSIALPWLIAAWAMMTGILNLVGSVRSRARKDEWWVPIWAGVIRLGYGVLAWFVPVTLPSAGNMSGRAVVFLLLTATMAILFGAVILAGRSSAHLGSNSKVVALLTLLTACSAPPATPLPLSKEQAIARATQDAKQSVPEVGIQQARIDNITAELITLAEADSRMGGQRGPAGYGPGQTPESPVWWVVAHGYFQYEGMGAPPNAAPICEADERVFTYDARTGESVGGSIPNTRCAQSGTPKENTAFADAEWVSVQAPGRTLYRTVNPFGRYRIEGKRCYPMARTPNLLDSLRRWTSWWPKSIEKVEKSGSI